MTLVLRGCAGNFHLQPNLGAQRRMADWGWDLLRSFVGAGAGTAAVTGAIALYRERGAKKASATYLAARLAVTLEAFTAACSELVIHNFQAEDLDDSGAIGARVQLPKLSDYPDDADGWKSLDPHQASDCLDFRNAIAASQAQIDERLKVTDVNISEYANFAACKQGIYAWDPASKIRELYSLKSASNEHDYLGHLKIVKEHIEQERAKRKDGLLKLLRS